MTTFSDLCDQTAQLEDFDKDRSKGTQKGLGLNSHLLNMAISNLSPFIENLIDIAVKGSFDDFKIAYLPFLSVMASNKHPAIIFLDDVQWADEGSMLLITTFMHRSEQQNMLFVTAYQDEEAKQVTDILECAQNQINIALVCLETSSVHQMVSSILESGAESIKELSNLVANCTAGNHFYVQMLINTINQEGPMEFNHDAESWTFNVDTIQEEIMVSNTMVNLLAQKLIHCLWM